MERPHIATLALTLLLVVPPATLATASASPSGGAGTAAASSPVTSSGTPPVQDASPSTILQGLYRTSNLEPSPEPGIQPPSSDRPLVEALEHLAEARGEDVDEAQMKQVRQDARDLPDDLRAALALVVEANAEATERAVEDATYERPDAARDALLVAQAVDAALPVLRKYSLFHASDAGALRVEQARTVDAVVALATSSEQVAVDGDDADLPGAVLDVYDQVGIEATAQDLDRLEAGSQALPDDVRRAATVLARGQAKSIQLRTEALEPVDGHDLSALSDAELQAAVSGEADDDNLADAQRWVDGAAGADAAKLRQAELAAVTAALQANAILEGQGRDEEPAAQDPGLLGKVWNGVTDIGKGFTDLVDTINPLGVASAQVSTDACPRGSPVSDCGNDVWFMDPFGIVVVSGPGTTVYDARYGQASLEDSTSRTLRRLPTDGVTVNSRTVIGVTDVEVRGSIPREQAENATQTNTIRSVDEAALRRPFYVASLDLGGDDLYTHHTASTLDLDPDQVEPDTVPLLASLLVDTGGNDRYDPSLADRENGTIANATLGGLGVLVDVTGDDVYDGGDASVATASTLGRSALLDLHGQDTYRAGAGSVAAAETLGSALLVDDCASPVGDPCTGGNDTVETRPRSQGWATTGGVAAYVNKGGADTYEASGSPAQGEARTLGVALFADVGGGEDTGIHPGDDGEDVEGLEDTPWTAEVVARPNDREVRARLWADDATSHGGAGLAVDIENPAAFQLTSQGDGVIASFERASIPGVDLPGLFFLDGASDTVYQQDYALTVDLSGYDTYRNNAGGAIDISDASSARDVAGTALALDLAGVDRYDARNTTTSTWGVQGAARGGAGLLIDLGRSSDKYRAGSQAQGAAGDDGVGLLLDDGSLDGKDRFEAGDASQGSAIAQGLGALVTGDGQTTYEAGSTSQGFGADGGVGLLVDRRFDRRTGKLDLDGLPNPTPSGDDTYRAGQLSQGAALDGGLGLLTDTGGDDTRVVDDRGQGYASPNELEDVSGVTAQSQDAADAASRALLVDLTGRDSYTATADNATAHGFADEDASSRTRALLADFALPRVPLLALDDTTGPIQEGLLGGSEISLPGGQIFPNWDPTDFYDDWLREGRGDRYVPSLTPAGQEKEENAYWEQPETGVDAGSSPSTTANQTAAGLGMDNPPIAAAKAGADRFFAAARMVENFYEGAHGAAFDAAEDGPADETVDEAENETTVDLRGLVVRNTKPEAHLDVTEANEEGCLSKNVNRTQPAEGLACFEVRVEQMGGVTGDPDRNMEVTFEVRPEGGDEWIEVGKARSQSYYEDVKDAFEEAGLSSLESIAQLLAINIDPSGGVGGAGSTSAVVRFPFNTDALCSETNATGVACPSPDDPAGTLDAAAWPDGQYDVRAEVETVMTTVTAGRSDASDQANMSVSNDPQLLGVEVTHPNPDTEEPGEFSLFTTDPHRGYEIEIADSDGFVVDTVAKHRSSGGLGQANETAYDGTPAEGRVVYETTAQWPDSSDDDFPQPERYQFEASINRYNRSFNVTQSVGLAQQERTPLEPRLDHRITNASATTRGVYTILYGGRGPDGIRDDIMRLDRPRSGNDNTAVLEEDYATLPYPVADAATVATGSATYLFGGMTPDGPTDKIIKIENANFQDPTIQVLSETLPTPLWDATAVQGGSDDNENQDNRVYIFGGNDAQGLRDEILNFDLDSESLETVNATDGITLPSPRSSMGGAWAGDGTAQGGVYLFGGVEASGTLESIIRYDPNAPKESSQRPRVKTFAKPRLSEPVVDPVVEPDPTESGNALVLGGISHDGPRRDILTLDPVDQEISPVDLPFPRFRADTLLSIHEYELKGEERIDAFVLGAGLYRPGATVEGNVSSDGSDPSVNLTRKSGPVGSSSSCPGDQVAIPVKAADAGSGVRSIHLTFTHRQDPEPIRPTESATAETLERTHCVAAETDDRLAVGAVAVDGAGNRAPAANATYFVDLDPPNATTTIPDPPAETDQGLAKVNATTFPVGWEDVQPTDTKRLHVDYRIAGEHTEFHDGITVEDPAASGSTAFPAADLEPDLVGHGTAMQVRIRAEDPAGNLQPIRDANAVGVQLDLIAPEIRGLDVDPGFTSVEVSWNLTETGVDHRIHVTGPDGETQTQRDQRAQTRLVREVTGLDDGTTYDITVVSLDEVGNTGKVTANFTTESSLVLDWQDPNPGAVLSETTPVRFLVGSADDAGGEAQVSLTAEAPNGSTTDLVQGIPFQVTGTAESPEKPQIHPYPINVSLDDAPEARSVTLSLTVADDDGSTSATRTVTIDRTPPSMPANATATLEGPRGPGGAIPWFRGPVNVSAVPVEDDVTGVNRTQYAWGSGPLDRTFDPDDPPRRTAEAVHTFRHRSVDEAGNVEPAAHERRFGIDTEAPTLTVSVAGDRDASERNVTLSVDVQDSLSGGAQVRTHLADEPAPAWSALDASTRSPTVTLPDEDGRHTVTVSARDQAGNAGYENLTVLLSTRPPAFEDAPSAQPVSPVAASVTWTTDKPSLTRLDVPNASASVTVRTTGYTTDHAVLVEDLEPASELVGRVTAVDRSGHEAEPVLVNITTPDDDEPPTAPRDLSATDTDRGAVVIGWSPAQDSSGIARYVVERSGPDDSTFTHVANATATPYVDRGVTVGQRYTYRVSAVDNAGQTGPAANASATPTEPPTFRNTSATVETVENVTVLALEVVVDPGGEPLESVEATVDGVETPMNRINATDEGVLYRAAVNASELSAADGTVEVSYTATDGDTPTNHPEEGTETVEADGLARDGDDGQDIPGPGPWLAAAAGVAAALALRRRGPPPGSPPGDPRTLK